MVSPRGGNLRWLLPAVALVALLGPLSPLGGGPAVAQGASVVLSPQEPSVGVGDVVHVDVLINDATDLYAASVHVTFDPQFVEVVDVDPSRAGVQILPGTFPGPSQGPGDIVTNAADNLAGTIDYTFTLSEPSAPVSGSGVLAVIRLRGVAPGTALLELGGAFLWDIDGEPIAATTEGASLEVLGEGTPTPSPTGQPAATATPTSTPAGAGATSTPTSTAEPAATSTPTRTRTPTRTPTATSTPAAATSTAVSQATPTPRARPPASAAQPTSAPATPEAAVAGLPSAGQGNLLPMSWRIAIALGLLLGMAVWGFYVALNPRPR